MNPKSGWEPGNWNARRSAADLGRGVGTPPGKRRGKGRKPTGAGAELKGFWSLCLGQGRKHDPFVLPPTHQDLGGEGRLGEAVQGLWNEV